MISVVIPTYNREKLIPRVLDNLLAQTNLDWQCIVVDDHSTDNTAEVVQQYVAKDSRFIYILNNRSKGAQGARNTGILIADGEWICLFDSDDIMYPDYMTKMAATLDDQADVIVCLADVKNVQSGKVERVLDKIHSPHIHPDLLKETCYVAYDVTLIRKSKLVEIGLLDEHCPSMQEWDTHIRLSKIATYKTIDESLCAWSIGGGDAITSSMAKHIAGRIYLYTKHKADFRKYAYRHYLNSIYQIWSVAPSRWQLLRLAPEMIIYRPLKKILNK